MSERTPGPWHNDDCEGSISINASDGGAIATAWDFEFGEDAAEANAKLIAAAPELLEALLLAQAAWLDRDRAKDRPDVIAKIQAAIRKATT